MHLGFCGKITCSTNVVKLARIWYFNIYAGVQEKLGVMNKGVVYTLWDYEAQSADELSFQEGDAVTILRKKDDTETDWWWAKLNDKEGYVPRNLLGVKYIYLFWLTSASD